MTPLYLFGSGTSPLPNVSKLTTHVLEAELYRYGDDRFRPIGNNTDPCPPNEAAANNPEFIRRLLALIRIDIAIYQERDLKDVSYEDVADTCFQLAHNEGTHRNTALQPYSDKLRDQLCTHFPKAKDQITQEFNRLPEAAVHWIQWAIYHEFNRLQKTLACNPIALKGFYEGVLRHTPNSTIITLNHDTLLEQVLGESINLGFAEDSCFSPESLADNKGSFKVLKLHGSIDWFYNHNTATDVSKFIREPSIIKFNTDGLPLIISGTINKLEHYNYEIFPWLWTEFQNTLRTTRRIIISGYGFKDPGINVRLGDWLKHYPDARLLIINPTPDDLIASVNRPYHVGGVTGFFKHYQYQTLSDFSSFSLPEKQICFIRAKFEEISMSADNSAKERTTWIKAFAQS